VTSGIPFSWVASANPWTEDQVAELHDDAVRWADSRGLLPTERHRMCAHHAQPALFGAMVWPHTRPNVMPWLARWLTYGFVVDEDDDDSDIQILPKIVTILGALDGDQPHPDNTEAAALIEATNGITSDSPNAVRARVHQGLRNYYAGVAMQLAGNPADPYTTEKVRTYSSAAPFCIALLEPLLGIQVPEHEHADPDVQLMVQRAAANLTLVNDYFSARVERHQYRPWNVAIIAAQETGDLEYGIAHAQLRSGHEGIAFDALARNLCRRDDISPGLRTYIQGLRDMLVGNRDWSLKVDRYREEVAHSRR
jgi:hypothetical protein